MFILSTQLQITALVGISGTVAAFTDLTSARIPNWLTGPIFLIGGGLHAYAAGWSGLAFALLGALACGVAFLPFYVVGGMGGGDIKLVAAEGCLLGLTHWFLFVLATAFCGAFMALVFAAMRRSLSDAVRNTRVLATHHLTRGLKRHPDLNLLNKKVARVPYALAIGSGAFLVLLADSFGQGYR